MRPLLRLSVKSFTEQDDLSLDEKENRVEQEIKRALCDELDVVSQKDERPVNLVAKHRAELRRGPPAHLIGRGAKVKVVWRPEQRNDHRRVVEEHRSMAFTKKT